MLTFLTDLQHGRGVDHMAADMDMLRRCERDGGVYLRLYTWEPPAVSLGCTQSAEEVLDREALERDGVEWVLRPTGGRPVLHAEDLTYSVAFPANSERFGRSIRESYRVVASCLIEGLRHAGIACDTHDSDLDASLVRREGKLPCFLAPNREEIMLNGRKLMGSAQKRTASAVLQHGSIPVGRTFMRLPDYLNLSPPVRARYAESLARKCTCVRDLRPDLTAAALAECLLRGFEESV
jgi:lipoyl(octanoyl) transferase